MNRNEKYSLIQLPTEFSQLILLDQICTESYQHRLQYQSVFELTGIPWVIIAAIHYRESSQSFKRHLHNGDPLTARTIHVPTGRPKKGEPPFDWVDSACDALSLAWRPKDWDTEGCLEFMERYNGLGYLKNGLSSPYLWSFTQYYQKGLFSSDGKIDSNRIDPRPGCAAILYRMQKKDFFKSLNF